MINFSQTRAHGKQKINVDYFATRD